MKINDLRVTVLSPTTRRHLLLLHQVCLYFRLFCIYFTLFSFVFIFSHFSFFPVLQIWIRSDSFIFAGFMSEFELP